MKVVLGAIALIVFVAATFSTPVFAAAVGVVDEAGKAVVGARVLVGSVEGVPFAGNILTTDAGGWAQAPAAWTAPQSVTIEAAGYVRATYVAAPAVTAVYTLRKTPAKGRLELNGQTTGFGALSSNGTMDVSLVINAIPRSDVTTLDLTQLIGTDIDKTNVLAGLVSLEIPANLSIPKQSESIVTVSKPYFRVFVNEPGRHRFATIRAQFDADATIDDLKNGKSFFDIINRLRFRSFSIRDFSITLPVQSSNLPVNGVALKAGTAVVAPTLPRGYAMVATALNEELGLFLVTDVKRLFSGERRQLMTTAQSGAGANVVLHALKKYEPSRVDFSGSDFEEMSTVLAPAGTSIQFLPIVKQVESRGRSIVFAPPTTVTGVNAQLTRVTLSKIEIVSSGALWLTKKAPVWDLYTHGFADQIELPGLGVDPWTSKGRYRWDLSYGASGAAESTVPWGPSALGQMTHVTRSAVDFLIK